MSAFPADFVWGAAAASQQIEGAVNEDGRGRSIWDVFAKEPGKVWLGQNADVACDHYHRWQEDVAHMRAMKLGAYRFSIAWPRVMPTGLAPVEERGLAFYDKLVDGLLEAGIQPWATLFHWDLPYELHCRGGWLNRDSADWFADYTRAVVDRLGDRVRHWFTFNEPQVFVGLGYERGQHAPGLTLPFHELLRMGHHILLAHGKAAQVLRAAGPCEIGFAPHAVIHMPATDAPEDLDAAREKMFAFRKTAWSNTWWSDPIFFGNYPDDLLEQCAGELPEILPGDMETIHQTPDFYGVNLYAGSYVRAGANGPEDLPWSPEIPLNAFKFVVTPEAMYWGTRFYYERYRKPIVISENGASCTDWIALDGTVPDHPRIDFTARYLRELKRAIDDGAAARAYFHWSLLDNFEWSEGYKERLGLIYVNYETQQRTWKQSAHWYQRLIETNGGILFDQG